MGGVSPTISSFASFSRLLLGDCAQVGQASL
jgi:hypothetical protein